MTSKNDRSLKDLLAFDDENERIEHEADMISMKIAVTISDYLEEKGISKKDLAAMLGTSPSYITQILRGDKHVNMTFLAKISRALGLSFDISFPRPKQQNSTNDRKLFGYSHPVLTASPLLIGLVVSQAKHGIGRK